MSSISPVFTSLGIMSPDPSYIEFIFQGFPNFLCSTFGRFSSSININILFDKFLYFSCCLICYMFFTRVYGNGCLIYNLPVYINITTSNNIAVSINILDLVLCCRMTIAQRSIKLFNLCVPVVTNLSQLCFRKLSPTRMSRIVVPNYCVAVKA